MELQHFSHNHRLIFNDMQNIDGAKICCFACGEFLFNSPSYGCTECKYFLHKSCAELPHEINHFLHPDHPLTLIAEFDSHNHCHLCTDLADGFTYTCLQCNFSIDSTCSSLPRVCKSERHQHPITLHTKPRSASTSLPAEESETEIRICQICNVKLAQNCVLYCCTTCSFVAHFWCVPEEKDNPTLNEEDKDYETNN